MTHAEIRTRNARQLFSGFVIRISFVIWISLFVIHWWLGVIASSTLQISSHGRWMGDNKLDPQKVSNTNTNPAMEPHAKRRPNCEYFQRMTTSARYSNQTKTDQRILASPL